MKKSILLLRIAIAFSFIYAAVSGFLDPSAWVGFFPSFVQGMAPAGVIIGAWGLAEVILALVILFMRNAFYPGIIAAVLLAGVTITNLGAMDIVFRDVSIALAALALAFLTQEQSGRSSGNLNS